MDPKSPRGALPESNHVDTSSLTDEVRSDSGLDPKSVTGKLNRMFLSFLYTLQHLYEPREYP